MQLVGWVIGSMPGLTYAGHVTRVVVDNHGKVRVEFKQVCNKGKPLPVRFRVHQFINTNHKPRRGTSNQTTLGGCQY